MTTKFFTEAEIRRIPVPPANLEDSKLRCVCLVKDGDHYRQCRRPPEFWMDVSDVRDGEVMVCFTHINAREVVLPL